MQSHEIFALLGPNGAGKTTLVRAITGRAPLDEGTVRVTSGTDTEPGEALLGIVPQSIALFPHLTARENLEVFARLAAMPRHAIAAAVSTALDRVELSDRADERTALLSGGMQRRLNIAAGILHDPPLLLLDEPTVGVDVMAREAVHRVLRTLRADGMSTLLTTHDLDQAAALADRVGVLSHGRLLAADTPARLIADAFGDDRELVVRLHGAPADGVLHLLEDAGLRPTHGETIWSGHLRGGLERVAELEQSLDRAGAHLDEVVIREPSLRSVFFHHAGEDVAG